MASTGGGVRGAHSESWVMQVIKEGAFGFKGGGG